MSEDPRSSFLFTHLPTHATTLTHTPDTHTHTHTHTHKQREREREREREKEREDFVMEIVAVNRSHTNFNGRIKGLRGRLSQKLRGPEAAFHDGGLHAINVW